MYGSYVLTLYEIHELIFFLNTSLLLVLIFPHELNCFPFSIIQPLGAADYIALGQTFHTIIIEKVPVLSPRRKVELRRFITLVDNMYDNKV